MIITSEFLDFFVCFGCAFTVSGPAPSRIARPLGRGIVSLREMCVLGMTGF